MKKNTPACKAILFFAMLLFSNILFSQNIIQQKKATPTQLIKYVKKATVFSLNTSLTKNIVNTRPTNLEINFELEGQNYTLQLTEQHVFSKGFFVKDGYDKPVVYDINTGCHYKGKIKGEPHSVVAINIYNAEINGIVAGTQGNINIGALEDGSGDMVIFREADMLIKPAFDCQAVVADGSSNNPLPNLLLPESITETINEEPVDVYFEADYSCYTGKSSNLTATINWVVDLANNVSVLYENDSVNVKMSAVKVWTVADPFVSYSTTADVLPRFANSMIAGFPGDLAHLLSRRGLGGGRAYLNSLCSSSYFKTAVSGNLNNGITPLPTFSWNSMVITHELGHNIASNHTQWCGWPGGAIDNCYATEGGCPAGPAPTNGGTIMSYCHLVSYGINLSNGFGPLPGAVIRNAVRNNTCIFPKVNFNTAGESLIEENTDTDNGCMDYKLITLKMSSNYAPSQDVQIQLLPTAITNSLIIGPQKDVELITPLNFSLTDTIAQTIQLKLYDDAIIEPMETFRLDYTIGANGTNAKKGNVYTLYITSNDHRPDSTDNQLVYAEDFESATLPGTWTTQVIYGAASPNRWVIGNSGDTNFTNRSAFISNNGSTAAYSGSTANDSTVVQLISPVINTAGFSNLRLTYAVKCLGEGVGVGGGTGQGGTPMDFGKVYYSANGGVTWTLIRDNIYGRNARNTDEMFLPASANNNPNGKIAFEWRNNTSVVNNPPLMIDSIRIMGAGPGPIQSEAHVSNSDTAYLGPNTTVHFYNQVTGKAMVSIKNLSDFDFGCTQVDLIRTGTGAAPAWNINYSDELTDKVYRISTANNNGTATYELSIYATAEEAAGWASATGNAATDLRIVQSVSDIRELSPGNSPVYGSGASNALFASNGDLIIKATFKQQNWYALGKTGIVNNCLGDIKQFASEISGSAYQWQVNSGSGFTNISNDIIYSGANTAVLTLTAAPTGWYGYQYRCVVTTSGGPQNSTDKNLKFEAWWKGGSSSAWELPANWECGKLPDANTDVFIPNTAIQYPKINSSTTIRTLTVINGATVTAEGSSTLTVLK